MSAVQATSRSYNGVGDVVEMRWCQQQEGLRRCRPGMGAG